MDTIKNASTLLQLRIEEQLAVVNITGNVYELITNLDESDNFIGILTEINQSSKLKAMLLLNDDEVLSEEPYNAFMASILEPDSYDQPSPVIKNQRQLFLMNQVLNRLIKRIIDFKKLFVVGLRGEVVSPFCGSSMAADFRFGSRKFSFLMTHQKYGLHPAGALPYFLTKFLHHSKAMELLLRETPIMAAEALQLGLVNQILEEHQFEEVCIEQTIKFLSVPACTLHFSKRLLNFTRKDLSSYLDHELELLNL